MAKSEVQAKPGMPDRVWFSAGAKLNLGNYSSGSVDVGMSTDCRLGETPQGALNRCKAVVDTELDKQVRALRTK